MSATQTQENTSPPPPDAKRYKATLNLPTTGFPMKANLVQNEPGSVKRWESANLYEKAVAARAPGAPLHRGTYVFHDGPPYANGSIHLGHLLNKSLKDFVVRSRLMMGLHCPYIPGWDCHGLPIEHKVMQEMEAAGKSAKLATLEPDVRRMAVRRECQKYAEKYVKHQSGQMLRLLTMADYAHPYLTMAKEYEGAVVEVFAELVARGLVYRRLKAVHWSIANETALAEAELEYADREDTSVYVDFEAANAEAVYAAFGLTGDDVPGQTPCFMIWTTTPWTLPANLGIAVHPKVEYALVHWDGNYTILAKDQVERVAKASKAESFRVLATVQGASLIGLRYVHPFVRPSPDFAAQPDVAMRGSDPTGIYRVVGAEYVTVEDGTGLVHTAPGHGAEDYQTGLREKLPIYCPVKEDGTYDASVPEWLRGKLIWKANDEITERLRQSGHLVYDHKFMHSYPHDWRSKTPVIFRATEQWFIGVDQPVKGFDGSLREMAMRETADAVRFVPEWGRNRMRGMLESRPDWCVSRQRAWGLPIPAFFAPDGTVLLTRESVRAVAKLFREKGSDAWFGASAADILVHYDQAKDPDAPKGISVATLTKSSDIFDVWFESGSSWNAVIRERFGDASYPTDLYLEGSDQHRGWFQSSLLPALGATGTSPFKGLLTHGFIVDKDGKKMSKSVGNTLEVEDLVKEFGADVCRWWVSSTPYENDIKADLEFFKTAGEAYRKVRNTIRFLLSNLYDFDSGAAREAIPPASIDAWTMAEFDRVIADVCEAYSSFEFHRATRAIYDYCNDTLSAVYLAAVKDRLYCDAKGSPRRRRTQAVLWDVCDGLCRLMAPILPHTADEAWRALHKVEDKDAERSVHLTNLPDRTDARAEAGWAGVMAMRETVLRELERVRASGDLDNPLDAGVVVPDSDGTLARFDASDLADLVGVSRFRADRGASSVRVEDLRSEPRCERSWKRDGTVRVRSDGGMLSDRDAQAVGVS